MAEFCTVNLHVAWLYIIEDNGGKLPTSILKKTSVQGRTFFKHSPKCPNDSKNVDQMKNAQHAYSI
jgi:hypothetical protein